MIISKVLLLASVATAELYIPKGHDDILVELPEIEDFPDTKLYPLLFKSGLAVSDLSLMRFDHAVDPMEVFRLPLAFFRNYMTDEQLQEMILNDKLKGVISGKYHKTSGLEQPKVMEQKVKEINGRLKELTPSKLETSLDLIVSKIPPSQYQHLPVLTVLTSDSFKPTIKNYSRLLGLSRKVLSTLGSRLRSFIGKMLKALKKLARGPNRAFAASKIILEVLSKYPQLASILGSRSAELSNEIAMISNALSQKNLMVKVAWNKLQLDNLIKQNTLKAKRNKFDSVSESETEVESERRSRGSKRHGRHGSKHHSRRSHRASRRFSSNQESANQSSFTYELKSLAPKKTIFPSIESVQ
ncbi:hypothetical protein PSACC_02780 [Paramicrosporidium saccamoebae]|uniref:Uncharacterized protein n=1 Tax=Paramicrosporidium saccamoebae TaxID=1246581 RepID=A0A2H9TI55_9FUNG|nr:hypothetical protein PSACC_02780 [Paramicrosporidium saccamoebae]